MVVMRDMIPEAKKLMKEYIVQPESGQEAFAILEKGIGKIEVGENSYDQKFIPQCITSLQLVGEVKGKTRESERIVNLSDLNAKSIKLAVKKASLIVQVTTNNKTPLVQVTENGEQKSYNKSIEFRASSVENAKQLIAAFKKAILFCQSPAPEGDLVVKGVEETSLDGIFTESATVSVEEIIYNQQLVSIEDDSCKWEYTLTTEGKKKTEEEVFQFNLGDLDHRQIDFNIKKTRVGINIPTSQKQKIIKYFKDGEPDNYQKEILIYANGVEPARAIMSRFKRAIEGCKDRS